MLDIIHKAEIIISHKKKLYTAAGIISILLISDKDKDKLLLSFCLYIVNGLVRPNYLSYLVRTQITKSLTYLFN